jgi:hypothetical protein
VLEAADWAEDLIKPKNHLYELKMNSIYAVLGAPQARAAPHPSGDTAVAILTKITKELHKEFWESGALALNRDQIVSLLEILALVAGQVDNLTYGPIQDEHQN